MEDTNNDVLREARRLWDLGLGIVWVHPRKKRPIGDGWQEGPRKDWARLAKEFRTDNNFGVRLGYASHVRGGYLAVLDVDVKSTDPRHKEEALSKARAFLNGRHAKCPIVISGRGGGSRHYYLVTDEPFSSYKVATSTELVKAFMPGEERAPSGRDRKHLTNEEIVKGYRIRPAWELEFMSEGKQVVGPNSIHPDSGKPYRWGRPLRSPAQLPLLTLSSALSGAGNVSTALTVVPGSNGNTGKSVTTGNTGKSVTTGNTGKSAGSVRVADPGPERSAGPTPRLTDFKVVPVELGWLPISDVVRDGIVKGTGVIDRSGFLLRASSALFSQGLTVNEVLTVLTDPTTFLGQCAYDHAKTRSRKRAAEWVYRYTVKRVADERSPEKVFTGLEVSAPRKLSPDEIEEQEEQFREERNWRQDLKRTKEGGLRYTLKNIDLIFSYGVNENVFVEDTFASRIQYGCDAPWGGKAGEYIQDIDLIRVKRWLSESEEFEPNTGAILEATSLVADRNRVHPVRQYLESLEWDGTPRIDTWIKEFCRGYAPEPYLSEVSRKFLLAMVKRVFRPGCQWDYVLVLEGKQGKYKSSIARALASDAWFMDNLPDLKDKDAMLNLQGKWLIELGELADVKRADYNLVKAYLVRRTDTVRPHYGRLKADVPRQSVFIGTINEGQYLRDPTGNRRYWPVKVGLCNVEALRKVKDQLFAEAMYLFKTYDEVLMLSPKAAAQATLAQEDRRVDDDESEMKDALLAFLESEHSKGFNFGKFKTRDLMIGANAPWGHWNGKGFIMNIAAHVLTTLGFERHKIEGQRFWKRTTGHQGRNGASF